MHTLKFIFLLFFSIIVNCYAQPAMPTLTKSSFAKLPGWQQDNLIPALQAFRHSCVSIQSQNAQVPFHKNLNSGKMRDWQRICEAAMRSKQLTPAAAREFFEKEFQPYSLSDTEGSAGLFTGYYLPLLHGSLQYSQRYHVPIYALPADLVKMKAGIFQIDHVTKKLRPYPDRRAINNGAILRHTKVLLWADDLTDVFFAQVQGSALVQLTNGHRIAIGYAGGNGHPYTSIGKVLVQANAIDQKNISMQTIRQWLTQHPGDAINLLNHNASFVFFKILPDHNPLGTQRVPLTPERSLAVDTHYLPLGVPVWLSTSIPQPGTQHVQPLQRLLIAQDTGGAIQGVVRGDIYWGAGKKAEFIAGHMQQPGKYWVLLPRKQSGS